LDTWPAGKTAAKSKCHGLAYTSSRSPIRGSSIEMVLFDLTD